MSSSELVVPHVQGRASYNSRRGALLRIIRDLQRFNEEQLKTLIAMAHKVRHSKRMLNQVAQEAEQMMMSFPNRSARNVQAENPAPGGDAGAASGPGI